MLHHVEGLFVVVVDSGDKQPFDPAFAKYVLFILIAFQLAEYSD